jgi:hypothetical protein
MYAIVEKTIDRKLRTRPTFVPYKKTSNPDTARTESDKRPNDEMDESETGAAIARILSPLKKAKIAFTTLL